jgi:hypothetical protein
MANLPFIGSTTYDIQEKFLEVAEKYFEVGNVNTLKVGLFGWLNECMAGSIKDTLYYANSMRDEMFLNTASMPRSINNWAKILNYNIATAKPSKMTINFSIKKNDIIEYGEVTPSDVIEFIIDKDNVFSIQKFNFILENSIKIIAKPTSTGTDYAITAQYIFGEEGTPFSNLQSPYLKTWIETIDNDKYLFIAIDIWQVEKSTTNFTVFSEDISDTLFYNISYPNQLAFFTVKYRLNNNTYSLPAYFNNTTTPDDERFCYYTFPNDEELQVYFSSLPGAFRPKFNSEVIIDIYSTLGEEAIFSYNGEIFFKFKQPKLSKVSVFIRPITDSSGAKNRPTLREIKSVLINEILTRKNLITEIDLNNFFNELVNQENINRSSLKFVRKRDDILRRLFSVYILMRNSSGSLVPTNTVNISADLTEMERRNYVIPAGTIVIYDNILKKYRMLYEDEYPEDYINRDNILIYSIPYLINVRMLPFPRITYYKNAVNTDQSLTFKSINSNVNYEFIANRISIERNSVLEDFYKITFPLVTNMEEVLVNDLKIRCVIKKGEIIYGYFDMERNTLEQYGYYFLLNTDDSFDSDGKFCLINSVKNIQNGDIINRVYIEEGVTLEIGILFNGISDKTKFGSFLLMDDIQDYCITNTFETDNPINLFRSMNNIMISDLHINESGVFFLNTIPVISTHFFNNIDNYKELYNIIDRYEEILVSNIDKLENNTSLDLKLYNTYGISQYYSCDTVNLKLHLRIKLVGLYTNELDTDIKVFIINYVEQANNNIFAVSNLIKELENNFEEISFIEFRSINNVNIQRIENLFPNLRGMIKEQLINYVPEYLNIGTNKLTFAESGSFNPEIIIEYL